MADDGEQIASRVPCELVILPALQVWQKSRGACTNTWPSGRLRLALSASLEDLSFASLGRPAWARLLLEGQ